MGTERVTVLLVEDEEMVRDLTKEILESHGFSVLTAAGGLEAMWVLQREAGRIELLITDLAMPDMGGIELVRRARAIRPDLSILYLSGSTPEQPGDAPFLEKPYTIDGLITAVSAALPR
ncbi:MAG: response regulator [Planctomycetota bacterium]